MRLIEQTIAATVSWSPLRSTHMQKLSTQTYFCCNALVPFAFQQVSHHLQVILLGGHVERSEAVLQRQQAQRVDERPHLESY